MPYSLRQRLFRPMGPEVLHKLIRDGEEEEWGYRVRNKQSRAEFFVPADQIRQILLQDGHIGTRYEIPDANERAEVVDYICWLWEQGDLFCGPTPLPKGGR